jgi:cytidyltransferase-like protein
MPRVLVAGTFDHLHAAHKRLLRKAIDIFGCDGDHLVVEIMPNDYCYKFKKLPYLIQTETERFEAVENYLIDKLDPCVFTVTIPKNEYGHAFRSRTLTDIVVGHDAVGWATMINSYRKSNGLPKLNVHILTEMKEDGVRISSTKVHEQLFKNMVIR